MSLPGFKAAPPADSQTARLPLLMAPVNKPQSAISKPYHNRMLAELGQLLGISVDALPPVLCGRVPLPLKIGIRDDLAARYPQADAEALGHWLRRWTNTDAYLVAVVTGESRHDLDGAHSGEVVEREAAHARDRLNRKKKKPASG